MILTVQFIDNSTNENKKVLGVCNLDIDTSNFKNVQNCYVQAINQLLKKGFNGNAVNFLQKATEIVQVQNSDMTLLSVDDSRNNMGKIENTIRIELGKGVIN